MSINGSPGDEIFERYSLWLMVNFVSIINDDVEAWNNNKEFHNQVVSLIQIKYIAYDTII